MVPMPTRYDGNTFEFSSIEHKYVYTGGYPEYAFDHAPPSKPSVHQSAHTGPFSNDVYSNWTGVFTAGYYLTDHQMLQEQCTGGYPYDTSAALYMTGYHAMEYEFDVVLPDQSGFLPDICPRAYSSPYIDSDGSASYPQTAWSPSEPSVASLSPPYDCNWEEKNSLPSIEYPLGTETEEVLQGLGLYDCPELASDDNGCGGLYAEYPSSGRGLKLEESFELEEEYSEDEDDDEDYDEDEDD